MSLKEVNMVPSAHALRIGIAAPHQCVGRGREEKMGRNVEAMLGDEPFIKAPNFRRITLMRELSKRNPRAFLKAEEGATTWAFSSL